MRARVMTMLEREDGFTLVELMVVVAIMSVLLVMSLTTYAGAKARGQDSGAKQVGARALQTARIVLTDSGTYRLTDAAALNAAETSVMFVDGTPSNSSKEVSVDVPDRATTGYLFVGAVYSSAGTCFYVRDWLIAGQGVAYGIKKPATPATCNAADTTGVIWYPKWS